MTWWKWALLAVAVLAVAATALVLLLPKNPNVGNRAKLDVTRSAADQRVIDTITISPERLAQATCRDGAPCWVAVDGVVYDMAGFPAWSTGRHHGVRAGTDATTAFVGAGHGRDTLQKMPVVGRYAG